MEKANGVITRPNSSGTTSQAPSITAEGISEALAAGVMESLLSSQRVEGIPDPSVLFQSGTTVISLAEFRQSRQERATGSHSTGPALFSDVPPSSPEMEMPEERDDYREKFLQSAISHIEEKTELLVEKNHLENQAFLREMGAKLDATMAGISNTLTAQAEGISKTMDVRAESFDRTVSNLKWTIGTMLAVATAVGTILITIIVAVFQLVVAPSMSAREPQSRPPVSEKAK